jgi:hypothetical protein
MLLLPGERQRRVRISRAALVPSALARVRRLRPPAYVGRRGFRPHLARRGSPHPRCASPVLVVVLVPGISC